MDNFQIILNESQKQFSQLFESENNEILKNLKTIIKTAKFNSNDIGYVINKKMQKDFDSSFSEEDPSLCDLILQLEISDKKLIMQKIIANSDERAMDFFIKYLLDGDY